MATLQFFNQKPVLHIAQTLERTNNDVCKALAARIRLCNSDKNNYIGKGMFTNDFGRKKDGLGSITACGSKFCPSCISKSARKNFRTTQYILENLYYPKFLTLTLPDHTLAGLSIDKQFEVFAYAYRELYRHSNFFQNKKNKPKIIDGTIKAVEFTDEDGGGNAHHVHYHLIADADYIDRNEFLAEWNNAFKIACNRFKLKFQPVTNFHIKTVVEEVTDEDEQISKIDVNRKVARYLTKPQNWHSIKPDELIEMVENETKNRMFAVTGTCAELARQGRELSKKARERKYQRTAYIYQQNLIVPTSTSIAVSTPASTTTISAAPTPTTPTPTPKKPRNPRKKSWRYRIKNKLITLEDYKKELDASFLMMCEFRMKQLPEKYYWATDFRTLDGVPFGTRLRYIEQDRKKQKRADNRFKRLGYEPVKNGSLFPELRSVKPAPIIFVPPSNSGKPAPVYNF